MVQEEQWLPIAGSSEGACALHLPHSLGSSQDAGPVGVGGRGGDGARGKTASGNTTRKWDLEGPVGLSGGGWGSRG